MEAEHLPTLDDVAMTVTVRAGEEGQIIAIQADGGVDELQTIWLLSQAISRLSFTLGMTDENGDLPPGVRKVMWRETEEDRP